MMMVEGKVSRRTHHVFESFQWKAVKKAIEIKSTEYMLWVEV